MRLYLYAPRDPEGSKIMADANIKNLQINIITKQSYLQINIIIEQSLRVYIRFKKTAMYICKLRDKR